MLLVEQNATRALGIADYAYVLETGRVVTHGTPSELSRDSSIIRSYLGSMPSP
jgi:branched-chain amino acid transport system ATP-binding protein